MAGEARVDEARRRMREQAEAAEAGLTFKTSGDVVTQRHNLIRGPENKLARMKDELAVSIDVHEAREIRLLSGRINDRILVVVKETEEAVKAATGDNSFDNARKIVEANAGRFVVAFDNGMMKAGMMIDAAE